MIKARIQALSKAELASALVALSGQVDGAVVSRALDEARARVQPSASSKRPFDMAAYGQRRVALRVCYFGERYRGFASTGQGEDDEDDSVESALFAAMRKVRLIEGKAADYSRCGRTDRGVSALSQVVALSLRHRAKLDSAEEIDYCGLLNRVLPEDVVVTAWSPCADDFDARFRCVARTYRYYVRLGAECDVDAMRAACALFEGTHDFRNFCKMDVDNATHFTRRVDACRLVFDADATARAGYCEIRGSAFLWHQVRMMMAILFLIGARREEPALVTRMFDVAAMPRRPAYEMAPEAPLVLFDVEFPPGTLDWQYSPEAARAAALRMHQRWSRLALGEAMARDMAAAVLGGEAAPSLLPASHRPIEQRPVGKSYEEKVQALKPEKRVRHSCVAAATHGAAVANEDDADE